MEILPVHVCLRIAVEKLFPGFVKYVISLDYCRKFLSRWLSSKTEKKKKTVKTFALFQLFLADDVGRQY